MAKTLTQEPTASEVGVFQAQMEQYLIEMRRMNEDMAREQREIEELRADTRANLDSIKKLLTAWEAGRRVETIF